jgi:uncharacterized protein YdaU (DUF1376 family)
MNFYQFHIGDYAAHTRHLNHLEDLAYRRLLDEYYLQECPLCGSAQEIARRIGMNDCSTVVQQVLNDFFEETEFGWSNKRCDAEIERYQAKQAQQIAAGRASAAKRKVSNVTPLNKRSTPVQQTFNQSTDVQPTKNHEPITNNKKTKQKNHEGFDRFWDAYPRKEAKGAALKAWEKALTKAPADAIIDRVTRWKVSKAFPEKQYVPLPASWLNAERWSDELPEDSQKIVSISQVFVLEGTPEWDAWAKARGRKPPVVDRKGKDGNLERGWYFPSLTP